MEAEEQRAVCRKKVVSRSNFGQFSGRVSRGAKTAIHHFSMAAFLALGPAWGQKMGASGRHGDPVVLDTEQKVIRGYVI